MGEHSGAVTLSSGTGVRVGQGLKEVGICSGWDAGKKQGSFVGHLVNLA